MTAGDLVIVTPRGLYCPLGDFYIDKKKQKTSGGAR